MTDVDQIYRESIERRNRRDFALENLRVAVLLMTTPDKWTAEHDRQWFELTGYKGATMANLRKLAEAIE